MARKRKQEVLPGMEDAAIEEIEGAAEEYLEVKEERMKLTGRRGRCQPGGEGRILAKRVVDLFRGPRCVDLALVRRVWGRTR